MSVSSQMKRPSARVKMPLQRTSQPWARSQERLEGRSRAGSEVKKVVKVRSALKKAATPRGG